MVSSISGSAGTTANVLIAAKTAADPALDKLRDAIQTMEQGQFKAQLYGRQLRQAANEASARTIKMLADFGADPKHLARMSRDLSNRILRDVATQGPDAIRVPQSFVAGQKYTFSLEIEKMSFSVGADGSFSMNYQKTSISITAESYVAGLGATTEQVSSYFGGSTSGNGLMLPEKNVDGSKDGKHFRLLVPIDPRTSMYGIKA
jgi:hypothetical protein